MDSPPPVQAVLYMDNPPPVQAVLQTHCCVTVVVQCASGLWFGCVIGKLCVGV